MGHWWWLDSRVCVDTNSYRWESLLQHLIFRSVPASARRTWARHWVQFLLLKLADWVATCPCCCLMRKFMPTTPRKWPWSCLRLYVVCTTALCSSLGTKRTVLSFARLAQQLSNKVRNLSSSWWLWRADRVVSVTTTETLVTWREVRVRRLNRSASAISLHGVACCDFLRATTNFWACSLVDHLDCEAISMSNSWACSKIWSGLWSNTRPKWSKIVLAWRSESTNFCLHNDGVSLCFQVFCQILN